MFIDSIRKTWDEPDNFAMKMGSTSFEMFITGKYFYGKDIFKIELREFDKWYVMSDVDPKFFPGPSGEVRDCIKYINMKISQQIGNITTDKLEKLSKIKFTIEEMPMYLETEKYNL